jgi:hypothetical protein
MRRVERGKEKKGNEMKGEKGEEGKGVREGVKQGYDGVGMEGKERGKTQM